MRGPTRKPTALLKLEGGNVTRIKEREANEAKPEVRDDCPLPPDWLNDEAKDFWEEIAPPLHACGLLTRVDETALSAYCVAYAEWRMGQERLQGHGHVIMVNGVPRLNPYVKVVNEAFAQMTKAWQQFGLTPSARARIAVNNKLAQEDDPWQRFHVVRDVKQVNGEAKPDDPAA